MPEADARGRVLRPLKNRDFRLVWAGQAVSYLGDSMYQVALAWSVYQVTGSTTDMGIVLAVNVTPLLLLTVFGGAVADRVSRRSAIIVCNTAAGLVTAALAFSMYARDVTIVGLAAAAFALGVITSFFGPAYGPVYRGILPVEDQQAASAIDSSAGSTAAIAGPLLAALIFSLGRAWMCFGIESATFFLAAGCTALASIPHEKVAYSGTLIRDVKSGLQLVLRTSWLRTLILISLLANVVCIAPLLVLLPAVVEKSGGDGRLLGMATAVQSGTFALFALLAGKFGHRVPRGVSVYLLVAMIGTGVAMLGEGAVRHWLILPATAVIGIGYAFNVLETTMISEQIPDRYLSRVFSITMVTSFALAPAGYAIAGLVARGLGDQAVLMGGGITLAAVSVLAGFATRWRLAGAVADLPEEAKARDGESRGIRPEPAWTAPIRQEA